jgi:5-methylcytosine-specific restriction endonuclease McrA
VPGQLDFGSAGDTEGTDASSDVDLERLTRKYRDEAQLALGWDVYVAQRPCPTCGGVDALIKKQGDQNVVKCRQCKKAYYNAPKVETGEVRRTVQGLRQGIKASQRARIIERDGRCVLCGSQDNLTVGHALSWYDADQLGDVGPYLNDDVNIFAMCETCNAGLGKASILPVTYHRIVLRLIQAQALDAETKRGLRGVVASQPMANRVS